VNRLNNLSAVCLHLGDCIFDAAICVKVHENPTFFLFIFWVNNEIYTIPGIVFQHTKLNVSKFLPRDIDVQHCGIELSGSSEVCHWNVNPNSSIVLRIQITHRRPLYALIRQKKNIKSPIDCNHSAGFEYAIWRADAWTTNRHQKPDFENTRMQELLAEADFSNAVLNEPTAGDRKSV